VRGEVCPVECIVAGKPEPMAWYFIDPDTCIDCGACVPESVRSHLPEDEVPEAHTMKADQERIPVRVARAPGRGGESSTCVTDIHRTTSSTRKAWYKAKDM